MWNSGSCGTSKGIGASDPSGPRACMEASRARCAAPTRKAVSAMPSGPVTRSRSTSARRRPVTASTASPAQSMPMPYSQRSPGSATSGVVSAARRQEMTPGRPCRSM